MIFPSLSLFVGLLHFSLSSSKIEWGELIFLRVDKNKFDKLQTKGECCYEGLMTDFHLCTNFSVQRASPIAQTHTHTSNGAQEKFHYFYDGHLELPQLLQDFFPSSFEEDLQFTFPLFANKLQTILSRLTFFENKVKPGQNQKHILP
jgi:hypothetical protein